MHTVLLGYGHRLEPGRGIAESETPDDHPAVLGEIDEGFEGRDANLVVVELKRDKSRGTWWQTSSFKFFGTTGFKALRPHYH